MQDAYRVTRERSVRQRMVTVLASLALATSAFADQELFDLSIEQLLSLEVTSVSRKAEALVDAPAAIYVITGEQLRRSGVTTIPDALRMAPGVHVAQIDANKWAVTARGFNGRFANKLLVMIDGRIVYTPLFSGVFWDVQDTLIEDIARIEVIRGPGATLWGANAVNGVINIITRHSSETHGGQYALRHGNLEQGYASARWGGTFGEQGDFRVFAKYFERGGHTSSVDGRDADGWDGLRIGGRADWTLAGGDELDFSAEFYDVASRETASSSTLVAPYLQREDGRQDTSGGHANLRWQRNGDRLQQSARLSWTFSDRSAWLFDEIRNTVAIDYQQRIAGAGRHDIVWGVGWRSSGDEVDSGFGLEMTPANEQSSLVSLFVQDAIRLNSDWQLTVGSKFEHNSFTGSEFQPNVRVLGKLGERSRLWASLSHAARISSRVEQDGEIIPVGGVLPPGSELNPFPLPAALTVVGSDSVDAEELTAWELGYRVQPVDNLQVDIALFRNEYERPGTDMPVGEPRCEPGGAVISSDPGCLAGAQFVVLPIDLGIGYETRTHGVELSADWRPRDNWHLALAWAWLDEDEPSFSNGQVSARQQGMLSSWFTLGDRWTFYGALRHVGDVAALGIDRYTAVDLRIAWAVTDAFELALHGSSLNDPEHPEFLSELRDIAPTEIRRALYVQARWTPGR